MQVKRFAFGIGLTVLLLLGIFLFPSTRIIQAISPWVCPGAVYEVQTTQPLVALTIDDGPDRHEFGNTTTKILNVLSKYNAHATLFLIGNNVHDQLNPLVQEIVNQGHELGNHMSYDQASIKLGDGFEADLLKTKKILDAYAPQSWMRPGVGFCTTKMAKIAGKHGYKMALGSIFPYDTLIPWSRFSQWFIETNLRPGAIIILHDGDQRGERTYQTLEKVLSKLTGKGYQVVSLSTLVKAGEPLPSQLPLIQPLVERFREPLILIILSPISILIIFLLVGFIVLQNYK